MSARCTTPLARVVAVVVGLEEEGVAVAAGMGVEAVGMEAGLASQSRVRSKSFFPLRAKDSISLPSLVSDYHYRSEVGGSTITT